MGLQHDGVGNDCDESPEDGKIMAAMVQSSYELFYWTTCAKERLLRYIEYVALVVIHRSLAPFVYQGAPAWIYNAGASESG